MLRQNPLLLPIHLESWNTWTSTLTHIGSPAAAAAALKTEDFVVNKVYWPHYGVYKGSNLKPADYDFLEVHEFVFGYLDCILRKTKKEDIKLRMLEHLKDLMEDCFTSPCDSIRYLHAILLGEMEKGHRSGTEGDKITRLRHKYTNIQMRESTTGHTTQRASNVTLCTLFQSGECNEEGDHITGVKLKHECACCQSTKNRLFAHGEKLCYTKQKKMGNK